MTSIHGRPAGVASLLAAMLVACAQTPTPAPTQVASLDCATLAAEIRDADAAQRAATQRQQDAWKVVVPFAVIARYGQARSAAQESGQRVVQLQQQATERGCPQP